jgi:hypothetical protein
MSRNYGSADLGFLLGLNISISEAQVCKVSLECGTCAFCYITKEPTFSQLWRM